MVCNHPSIVTFYGSGVKTLFGKPFGCIYMMSTHHGNAWHWLLQRGPLKHSETNICMADITSAVSHCHNLGVAHRDIKLENLLLRSNAIENGLLLADFGLSARLDHDHLCYDKVGTVPYRAPEVGAGPYCPMKADLWSLGVVLWTFCYGSYPFKEASAACPRFARFQKKQSRGIEACDALLAGCTSAQAPLPLQFRQTLTALLRADAEERVASEVGSASATSDIPLPPSFSKPDMLMVEVYRENLYL